MMKFESRRLLSYTLMCVLGVALLPTGLRAQTASSQTAQESQTQRRQRRAAPPAAQTPQATPTPAPTATPAPPVNAPGATSPASLDGLRLRLRDVLAQPSLASAHAAVKIVSLDTGRTLFEENAGKLLNPASNMKILTVAAALARLSPDFRITTSVFAPAPPDATGTIAGDLRIYGRGDPSYAKRFTNTDARAAIDDLAARIQAAGVRRVTGDLIADESYFAGAPLGRGWEWDDLQWYYGAEISALSVGDNAIELSVTPAASVGAPPFVSSNLSGAPLVTVMNVPPVNTVAFVGAATANGNATLQTSGLTITPAANLSTSQMPTMTSVPDSFLRIVNRAVTAPSGTPRSLRVNRPLNSNVIEISGSLPQGGNPFSGSVAVSRPALLFGLMLREALMRRGIIVTGQTRAVSREDADFTPAPLASLVEIASKQSPPLAVIARETMKPSQNLYTELLLRQLAAPLATNALPANALPANAPPATGITAEAGLESLRAFLRAAGIADNLLMLADGSGLSRGDFITADAVVQLLTFMDKHPYRAAFRDTLPIAGVDGTLRNRMKNTRATGNLIAKTGTLSNATSLSGYVTTRGGERLVFSLIINNYLTDVDARVLFTDSVGVLLADFDGRS